MIHTILHVLYVIALYGLAALGAGTLLLIIGACCVAWGDAHAEELGLFEEW